MALDDDNIFKLQGGLHGPRQTPYNGGFFSFNITFSENYPQEAPIVCFETPIYHVTINPIKGGKNKQSIGFVCNSLNWWNPKDNMRNVFINIFSLVFDPKPEVAYENEIAKEYINNKELYDKKARYFAKKYASPFTKTKYDVSKSWDFTYDE